MRLIDMHNFINGSVIGIDNHVRPDQL